MGDDVVKPLISVGAGGSGWDARSGESHSTPPLTIYGTQGAKMSEYNQQSNGAGFVSLPFPLGPATPEIAANFAVTLPQSPLEQQRHDALALTLEAAVKAIVEEPDQRWNDEQTLIIGISTQALKKWLMNRSPRDGD